MPDENACFCGIPGVYPEVPLRRRPRFFQQNACSDEERLLCHVASDCGVDRSPDRDGDRIPPPTKIHRVPV